MTEYREIKLERTVWALHIPVTTKMLGDVSARAFIGRTVNECLIQLKGQLFYEGLERIEYPADWWQAFKARWLPLWARRRWPVRYQVYEINAYYPTFRVPGHDAKIMVPRLAERVEDV